MFIDAAAAAEQRDRAVQLVEQYSISRRARPD
jgi:hypothetical protein